VNPISQSSENAIRALTYLAQRAGPDFHLVRDMARELDVPAPFLSKILQPFVGRGLLESQRGRGGGYRLARPPSAITLYDIVDALEFLGAKRRCFLGQAVCSDERACPMHAFWSQSSTAFLSTLAEEKLEDVVRFCEKQPGSGYPQLRVEDSDGGS